MPRPKVHPSNRQRAAEACNFCRMSKKRCSATVPCTACVKRGIEDTCKLTRTPKGPGTLGVSEACFALSPPVSKPSKDRVVKPTTPHVAAARHKRNASNDWSSQLSTSLPSSGSTFSIPQDDGLKERRSSSFGTEFQPRMLLNSSGDRMYIGGAASISFLQLVRDTVSANLGPSQFSHNENVDTMLETQPLSWNADCPSPDFFSDEVSSYFDVYCSSTTGLLDILSTTELAYFCRTDGEINTNTSPVNSNIQDLVIAIGAQCQSLASAQNAGERYFRRAQLSSFSTMLESPSVDMVRIFLLMSFYMLGQCRRNTAFMYLGIAARAATSVGLHSGESYTNTSDPDVQFRKQVWMSLCNVDILVSSILGRPPATNGLRLATQDQSSSLAETTTLESTPILATFQILTIVNEIVNRIYVNKDNSIATAEELLERVEKWSRKLPRSLNNRNDVPGNPTQKESIAEMHISCIYYYAVTLITRPVLVSALTSGSGSAGSQLASACLDAAVFLVQACTNLHSKNLLIGNMAFIKALVFASGLILGFDLFVEQKGDPEIHTAFHGAQNILAFLSAQSPQAAHYLDILALLSRAVASKRQRQNSRGRNKYVEKLFSREQEQDITTPGRNDSMDMTMSEPGTKSDDGFLSLNGEALPPIMEGMDIELPFDWDILEIAQWDSFPIFEQKEFRFD